MKHGVGPMITTTAWSSSSSARGSTAPSPSVAGGPWSAPCQGCWRAPARPRPGPARRDLGRQRARSPSSTGATSTACSPTRTRASMSTAPRGGTSTAPCATPGARWGSGTRRSWCRPVRTSRCTSTCRAGPAARARPPTGTAGRDRPPPGSSGSACRCRPAATDRRHPPAVAAGRGVGRRVPAPGRHGSSRRHRPATPALPCGARARGCPCHARPGDGRAHRCDHADRRRGASRAQRRPDRGDPHVRRLLRCR